MSDVWTLTRECRRGVGCVGPDRYPEAVTHHLRHNRKRDDGAMTRASATLRENRVRAMGDECSSSAYEILARHSDRRSSSRRWEWAAISRHRLS